MNTVISKAELLKRIDEQRDRFIEILADLIRRPSENPPGDTSACVDYLKEVLTANNLPYTLYEPEPGLQSLACFSQGAGEKTLVLNGHLDVFPAGDLSKWENDPCSALVRDGRIYGRGSSDMKAGTAASFIVYLLFHELGLNAVQKGNLALMMVADEETGGLLGTEYILDADPRFAGDAVLIGEPSGGAVRFGQRGRVWLRFVTEGESYHGGLGTAGRGPVERMCQAIGIVSKLKDVKGVVPEEIKETMEQAKQFVWLTNFPPYGDLLDHISVSAGYISGGTNVNVVPDKCEAMVDIRIPLGVEPGALVDQLAKDFAEADLGVEIIPMLDPYFSASYTPPEHEFVQTALQNAREIRGSEPPLVFTPTANDAILFLRRGIASVVYGPRSYNMAAPDEYITLDDYINTIKVHAGIAYDYLVGKE